MKILHTADVHLQKRKPETLEAVKLLIELGKNEEIDLMTIGGDFFNKPNDGDELRTEIRKLFNDLPFPVLIIPGNHDSKVFKSNLDFGSSFHFLIKEPVDIYKIDNGEDGKKINIVGLPFREKADDEILSILRESADPSAINILIIHCTLDIAFSSDDFGEEEREYFSISQSTLKELGYNYILAGHFHKKYDWRILSDSCQFVYPGSPVSLTKKELGKRYVAIVDTKQGKILSKELERTFTREIIAIKVLPGNEKEKIAELREKINSIDNNNTELSLRIEGYGALEETELRKILAEIDDNDEKVVEIVNNYISVNEILQHPLYERFSAKLKEKNGDNKEKVEEMALEAMRKVIRGKVK